MGDLPSTYVGAVRQWECDHMGHLNVTYYVAKFDAATWNFFSLLGLSATRMRELGCGMVALEQNIRFRRELLPGATIEVRTHTIEIAEKTIRFLHEMTNRETNEIAATCEMLGICLDTGTRRTTKLPDDVRGVLGEEGSE